MEVISSNEALRGRRKLVNPNSGAARWRTPFLGTGTRVDEEVVLGPLAFLIEMTPASVLPPHFHPVDQFQIFVAGSGELGRHPTSGLAVHYADHHTGYGPITAGPHGIAYFTLRGRTDARGIFLHNPGAREQLRPSKKRFRLTEGIVLSVPPVLRELPAPVTQVLLEDEDKLGAFMIRAGAGASVRGPEPAGSSGQYYLVVGGSARLDEMELPLWSLLWAYPDDPAPDVKAGNAGAEVLILQFP